MFLKLLTALILMLAAAVILAGRRAILPSGGTARAPARVARVSRAEDLVECGRCGVWLPGGQRCDCAGRG